MIRQIKKGVVLLAVVAMLMPGYVVQAQEDTGSDIDKGKWELVWSDEFNGNVLDESKWAYETGSGHNGEEQYYTKDNVSVSDGTLKITAKAESKSGYNYTSGRLETITEEGEALFSTQYGRIEARIKLPAGQGLWPAFWMQPVDNEYGSWPLSGEIDIMEARGRILNEVSGAIHFGESRPFNKQLNETYTFSSGADITDFHVYAVEWKENEIIWYVDGEEYYRASNWYTMSDDGVIAEYPAPFNKEFYLILNLAVGGNYDNYLVPNGTDLPATMEVDYVRVYHDVNGYAESGIKMPEGTRDEDAMAMIPVYENNNLLSDIDFENINTSIKNIQEVDISNHNWYFTTNKYFTGVASLTKTVYNGSTFVNIDITDAGSEVYSIQLIQKLPLAKGYIYKVKFDAMCPDGNKTIKVKAYGETNYCSSYKANLTPTMQTFEFSFLMAEETDLNAMLQMNLGEKLGDVIIGNVSVIAINNGYSNSKDEVVVEKPSLEVKNEVITENPNEEVKNEVEDEVIIEKPNEEVRDEVVTEKPNEEIQNDVEEEDKNSKVLETSGKVKNFINKFKKWLLGK